METSLQEKILAAVKNDPRVIGLVNYGSSSEGRGDVWSDFDLTLFLRDADFADFKRDWKIWAGQFGSLLLAYIGGVGHPWAVYDALPIPQRVDYHFITESDVDVILTWPNAPISVEAMVLYDLTGKISSRVQHLVGQSLQPADPAQAFEQVCGDFWYYLLRTYAKLKRGQYWAVRYDYNAIILGNLHALLRLEANATDHWRSSLSAVGIETVLMPQRLAQLNQCIPGIDLASLLDSFKSVILLGKEVCRTIADRSGWSWPSILAEQVEDLWQL